MKISVFASDANPAIDKRLLRRSLQFCEREVLQGRAKLITANIWDGIQLVRTIRTPKTEARGSREQSGSLTAYESILNAEYFGSNTRSIGKLSQHYEIALENHILKGLKGMPRKCGIIAARVKTILSNPSHA